jgi:limonene-1,2-epoxide hydrolase
MPTPTEVVERFCAAFSTKDVETIASLLADDVVYHNVGMAPADGKEASLVMIQGFLDMAEGMNFEIHRIAAQDDSVLTERTDTFTINGTPAPIPVMGAFDLRDGLIVGWRDYFDLGIVTKMMGGEAVDASVLPVIP